MNDRSGAAPERLDRSKFSRVFADDFTGDGLDNSRWVPHYLPTGRQTSDRPRASSWAIADYGFRVRSPQPTRRLWTPSSGLAEATMRATRSSTWRRGPP